MDRGFRQANSIDIAIGDQIRRARVMLRWSQSRLGREIGVSFQQIQKYETGATRLSANRLVHLSEVLRVPVSFLLRGAQQPGLTLQGSIDLNSQALLVGPVQTLLTIDDPSVRAKVLEILQALAVVCSSVDKMR